jgi:hypothetical protein
MRTATNPETGEKLVEHQGKWIKYTASATNPKTGQKAFNIGNEWITTEAPQQSTSMYDRAGQFIEENVPALPELGAAVSRGATQTADFFGNIARVPANRLLQMAGSDYQIPSLTQAAAPVTTGNFMEEGLARDVVRSGGELVAPGAAMGAGMRTAGRMLPQMARPQPIRPKHYSPTAGITAPGESTAMGVTRSITQTTPQLEAGLAGLAGAGAEFGQQVGGDVGEITGAVLAPSIPGIAKSASVGIVSAIRGMSGKDPDIAAKMLAEAMVREGIGPDEAMTIYQNMGQEAVPADIGDSFARLLRVAVNKVPRIEGLQRQTLNPRHETQINRLDKALGKAASLGSKSLDTELDAIERQYKPKIDQLYGEAKTQPLQMSPKMRAMIETPNNAVNTAFRKAQRTLNNKRLAGDEITHVSVIDATKQKLDDMIGVAVRKGEKNEAYDLVRLKHRLIDEADKSIPKYKEARNMFAGKEALKSASESGKLYFKMNADEIKNLTSRYSTGEKQMFRLGMRQALLDKVDDLKIGADAIRATFGKKGDLNKLRFLFDNNKEFKQFRDALKLESEFALTRRTAQANSTTAKQIADENTFFESVADTIDAISSPGGALGLINKAVTKLKNNKKGNQAYMDGLEEVGDFLLAKGMQPERVREMLKKGDVERIEKVAKALSTKESRWPPVWAAAALATSQDRQTGEE